MEFSFIGEALCLDFANTAGWHLSEEPSERLTRYADLLDWAGQAGAIGEGDLRRLRQLAGRDPEGADRALQRAIALREALFRVFLAVSRGERADPADLEAFNHVLTEAMARATVRADGSGFAWDWRETVLDRPLWPVARSAAELLTGDQAATITACQGDRCGWLFLNRTRRRRWCSMADCGNRAKAARHYERVKAQRG